jgi:hypothetical protein
MAIVDEAATRGQKSNGNAQEQSAHHAPADQSGRAILFGRSLADSEKALRMARSAYSLAAERRSRRQTE